MVDGSEIGKKRSMIVPGSDSGRTRELDDIPLRDVDAPKVPDQSPAPITIETMSRYLRELTSTSQGGRPNAYPIKDGFSIIRSHAPDGSPAAIVTPSDEAANVFASASDRDVIASLAGQMFDEPTLQMLNDPSIGLHEILRSFVSNKGGRNPEVPTPENAPEVQKKISSILKRNRFNPDPGNTPFLPISTSARSIDALPIGRGQAIPGEYDSDPADVTYEQMKKVGLALMLRATGEFIGRDGDPTSVGNSVGALVPGSAQLLGAKVIDRKSMWAGDLSVEQGRPPNIGVREKSSPLDLTMDGGASSYGALNSHLEPFDGFAPVGMLTLGAALIVAVKLLSESFELILQVASPPGVPGVNVPVPPAEGAIMVPGSSRYESLSTSESIVGFFGFTPTRHNYSQAFDRGVDVFFGFNGVGDIGEGAKRLLESPGYYVVMIREIIRSGGRIVESIADAFKAGPVGAVQGLLGLVDIIRGSKIIGYFNMVAHLGDILLTLEDDGIISENSIGLLAEPGELPNNGKISTIDRLVNNPASRISKNRIGDNDSTLAWRNSATPSAYLLPGTILNAADYMPTEARVGLTSFPDVPEKIRLDTITDVGSPRLSADVAKQIEAELDSEYVPFYFHDLRTNEFVSFHAFLAACNDSFNVTYNSANYYGRVDPVRIYERTERSINLTFNVVSTSPNDFDVMWWKINKLVTMLYPQWSRGRKLVVDQGQNEFIQPFSQVPTSSPVIRLRLGDVFKSNYSKFALARLFGLGTPDFIADGVSVDPNRTQRVIDFAKAIADEKERILRKPVLEGDFEKFGYRVGQKAILLPAPELVFAPRGPVASITDAAPAAFKDAPIKGMQNSVEVEVNDYRGVQMASKKFEPFYYVTIDKKHVPDGFSAGPYIVSYYQLQPSDDDIRQRVIEEGLADDPGTISDTDISTVRDFFDGSNNAIVRSFESVAGRGLAGVITSMAFDWKTPTWDTRGIGRRAPQWCQVIMTFMPIHDITPGIDEHGFNRAPIYNVGGITNDIASDPHNDGQNEETFARYHREIAKTRRK